MRREGGFTLIEIVITITMLAIIISTAYGALHQMMRGSKILRDRRELLLTGSTIINRMAREFQLIAYKEENRPLLTGKSTGGAPGASVSRSGREMFLGEDKKMLRGRAADSVTFIAQEGGQYLPDGGTHGGYVQITYRVVRAPRDERPEEGEEPLYLIREEMPYIWPLEKAEKKKMIFPVSKSLIGLNLRYFDKEKSEWVEEWKRPLVPDIIEISLAVRSQGGAVQRYTTEIAIGAHRE